MTPPVVTTEPRARGLVRSLLFVVASIAATQVGLLTFSPTAHFSMVWPVSGVTLLWLASSTRRDLRRDLVLMAAATGVPVLVALHSPAYGLVAVAQSLAQPLVTLFVIRALSPQLWSPDGGRRLSRSSDVVVFLTGCLAGAVASVAVRGAVEPLIPLGSWQALLLVFARNLSWVVALGAVGFLIGPRSTSEIPARISAALRGVRRPALASLEAAAIAAATVGAVSLAYLRTDPVPVNFLIMLCAVWAGCRLPPIAALLQPLGAGVTAVLITLSHGGVFVHAAGSVSAGVLSQSLLTALVVVNMTLSVGTAERKAAMRRAHDSEQQAAERAHLLSMVMDHIQEGLVVVESPNRLVLRNAAARAVLDEAAAPYDAHRLLGSEQYGLFGTDGELVPDDQVPASRALAGDRIDREDYVIRNRRHPAGRILEISATPVDQESGDAPRRALVMYRDVTAERQDRDNLTSFAGVVAHDLQNPLAIATGWTEALLDAYDEGAVPAETARDMLVRVHRATGHMRAFIDDLLTFTIARDHPLRLEDSDLSAITEHVAGFRRDMDSKPVIDVQPGMEVNADASLIRQVLDNLIGNACKYVAADVRPHVTINAETVGARLVITVADNGIGIPEKERERVFETFQRASKEYAGTGIGLAIVERIVARHGGSIEVLGNDDVPGTSGSRFVFDLPVRVSVPEHPSEDPGSHAPVAPQPRSVERAPMPSAVRS